jgi:hypothetical protein
MVKLLCILTNKAFFFFFQKFGVIFWALDDVCYMQLEKLWQALLVKQNIHSLLQYLWSHSDHTHFTDVTAMLSRNNCCYMNYVN